MYMLGHGGADAVIIFLLVFLSFGWTVTFVNHKDFDIYIPICAMLTFIHILLSLMNKATDGEHDKYHMFDGYPAYVMIAFRLALFGMFIYGFCRTYKNLPER
jgi:hypothetical protein